MNCLTSFFTTPTLPSTPITTPTTNDTTTAITSASPTTTAAGCSGTAAWIADGYCDDINNNIDCTYDGRDCCGPNVNTLYCTECMCYE